MDGQEAKRFEHANMMEDEEDKHNSTLLNEESVNGCEKTFLIDVKSFGLLTSDVELFDKDGFDEAYVKFDKYVKIWNRYEDSVKDNTEAQMRIENLKTEKIQLEDSLQLERGGYERFMRRRDLTERDLLDVRQETTILQSQNKDLEQQLQAQAETISELKARLYDYGDRMDQDMETIRRYSSELTESKDRANELENQRDSCRRECHSLRDQLVQQKSQFLEMLSKVLTEQEYTSTYIGDLESNRYGTLLTADSKTDGHDREFYKIFGPKPSENSVRSSSNATTFSDLSEDVSQWTISNDSEQSDHPSARVSPLRIFRQTITSLASSPVKALSLTKSNTSQSSSGSNISPRTVPRNNIVEDKQEIVPHAMENRDPEFDILMHSPASFTSESSEGNRIFNLSIPGTHYDTMFNSSYHSIKSSIVYHLDSGNKVASVVRCLVLWLVLMIIFLSCGQAEKWKWYACNQRIHSDVIGWRDEIFGNSWMDQARWAVINHWKINDVVLG